MGVRFFDNARGYQSGGSEERMGKMIGAKIPGQDLSDDKVPCKNRQQASEHLDLSLKALKTDS